MPNPGGANQFDGFGVVTIPYGEKARQGDLQRSAPLPPAPALDAPERARKAVGKLLAPEQARQAAVAAAPPLTPAALAPPMQTAAAWRLIASLPGVTPLAQDYLGRAESQSGGY